MIRLLRSRRSSQNTLPRCDHPHFLQRSWPLTKTSLSKARTQDWATRREAYWQWRGTKAADERRFGPYDWVQWGVTRHHFPERLLTELLLSDQADGADDYEFDFPAREVAAYQLRSTIAMYRRRRVGSEFHGFADLPRELRDMIYAHILVRGRGRGRVLVPNSDESLTDWQDDGGCTYKRYRGMEEEIKSFRDRRRRRGWAPPYTSRREREQRESPPPPPPSTTGLIHGVSRAVHQEATEIFFGCNQIILPAGPFAFPRYFGLRVDLAEFPTDFVEVRKYCNYAMLARDVSYTFDMRDHLVADRENLEEQVRVKDGVDDGSLPPLEAMQMLHDQKLFWLEVDWSERIDSIKEMKLDRLQLSFEECYCAVGCCRKVGWVLDRFVHHGPLPGVDREDHVWSSVDWKHCPPMVVEIIGWANPKEKEMIQDKLSRLPNPESFEVRFI